MQPIAFQYKGSRHTYHVYHPAKHGPPGIDGQWERSAQEFRTKLDDFVAVCRVYGEQQTLSETVAGDAWKRDIVSFVGTIESEGKNVYELEALCELIFDVDSKTSQRETTYHAELKKLAERIRFDDSGLVSPMPVDPKVIQRVGWTGR